MLAALVAAAGCHAAPPDAVIDHAVVDIDGRAVKLSEYRGKVALIVNVASECGYTPQYADLQELYQRFRDRGFVVLGFPSNDFGGQEPGDGAAIKKFAKEHYDVTFPLFDKVHAKNGPEQAPLYRTLTHDTRFPGDVKWNFTKFLVDKSGHVVARFPSETTPLDDKVLEAVNAALSR